MGVGATTLWAQWLPSDVRRQARAFVRRPELGASLVIAGAWAVLLIEGLRGQPLADAVSSGGGRLPLHVHSHAMSMVGSAAGGVWPALVASMPHWLVMTVAMMGPAALAGIRHTGLNSFRWRRSRAMLEFSAGYLAVWMAFGVAVVAAGALAAGALAPGLVAARRGSTSVSAAGPVSVMDGGGLARLGFGSRVSGAAWLATGIMLAAAAAWQLTAAKRRSLRDCHRSVPLPPRGWRAELGAIRFGVRNGSACLGSCWCLMLVMTVVPGGHLLWTAALTVFSTAERLLERPRKVTRFGALALGVAALVSIVSIISIAWA